ncbi:MAG: helix-turn-helix domain-containing protein [Candidatus Sumerlaeaceae bacterium]|nr:helix-turn-helix domain-containing protein [Candidatus Sumerlaeaceae bacterium]
MRLKSASRTEREAGGPRALRLKLGLDQHQMARVLDISVRSLSDLENGGQDSVPTANRRLTELRRFYARLSRVARLSPRDSRQWFLSPNRSLGNLSPLEAIERGHIDRLWDMVFQLESGALS